MTRLRIYRSGEHGALPRYMTEHAAGLDLAAAVDAPLRIESGERALIPTGLHLEIPVGYEAQIRPRSGLAIRHGVTVINAPGTIDADYRGEVKVALINLGAEPVEITPKMRIAQMVVAKVTRVAIDEVDALAELTETARGAGAFGHTGQR